MKPRTQEELDAWNGQEEPLTYFWPTHETHWGADCTMCGPSWWGPFRGCYVAAQENYAMSGQHFDWKKVSEARDPYDHDHLKSMGFGFDNRGGVIWEKK